MQKMHLMIVDEADELLEKMGNTKPNQAGFRILATAAGELNKLRECAKSGIEEMLLDVEEVEGSQLKENGKEAQKNLSGIELTILTHDGFSRQHMDSDAQYYVVCPVHYDEVCRRFGKDERNEAAAQSDAKALRSLIDALCIKVGIPIHIQGYAYICEAVQMVVCQPDIINRITRELYPGIASRYETSSSKVERSIRHAVSVLWQRGRVDAINQIFGFPVCAHEKKLTNGEFIALLANRCKAEWAS